MIDIKGIFVGIAALILCSLSTSQLYAESYLMHTVQAGESYYKIADDYNVSTENLQKFNNQSSESLKIGSLVKVKQIKEIKVTVNGKDLNLNSKPYIENGHVFMPLRFLSEALSFEMVEWNQNTMKASVKAGSRNITVNVGSDKVSVDGKVVKIDAPVQFYDNRVYVPIKFFSETIGEGSIDWEASTYTAVIKSEVKSEAKIEVQDEDKNETWINNKSNYSEDDLYWLSRIVDVEAGSDTFEGKVAVANVIINRKNSPVFPNTIKGVIFDTKYGVQFPPAKNGKVNRTPSKDSIDAAKKALEGYDNVGQSLYFENPSIKNSWIARNRKYFGIVGAHAFYQ